MYFPPLNLADRDRVYVNGDVTIDPSAAIAPGTILQAAPNSRLIVAAGVCIGMGAVIEACGGTLEIKTGATLGAGVLAIGWGEIGANACVGAATTIVNASVESWQVIPAGSVVGDSSRQVAVPSSDTQSPSVAGISNSVPSDEPVPDPNDFPGEEEPEATPDPAPAASPEAQPERNGSTPPSPRPVYGQAYLNQILGTLFPYNPPGQSASNHRPE